MLGILALAWAGAWVYSSLRETHDICRHLLYRPSQFPFPEEPTIWPDDAIKRLGGKDKAAGRLGFYLRWYSKIFRDAPDERACVLLAGCGRAGFGPLKRGAAAGGKQIRITAISMLPFVEGVEPSEVLPGLRDGLGDPNAELRLASVIALGSMGSRATQVVAEVEKLCSDDDPQVRRCAAEAIRKIRGGVPPPLNILPT
jgi:hypothetical protein